MVVEVCACWGVIVVRRPVGRRVVQGVCKGRVHTLSEATGGVGEIGWRRPRGTRAQVLLQTERKKQLY